MPGTISNGFEPVRDAFAQQIETGDGVGGAVAVYHRGKLAVDLWGGMADRAAGHPWQENTMCVVYSTTKGATSTCLHMLVDRGQLSYDDLVVKHWPEFAKHGKDKITVRHVLTHQAGMPQQPKGLGDEQTLVWDRIVRAMENLEPMWKPGEKTGYHAINFGWLAGEIIRRIDGRTVGAFLGEEVCKPLGLRDLYIGLPESEEGRVARLESLLNEDADVQRIDQMLDIETIAGDAAGQRMADPVQFYNRPETHRAELPAAGGIATARDLARLYACLGAGGTLDGVTLMRPDTIATATAQHTYGPDAIINFPMGWALGYMTGGATSSSGPRVTAFGHAGFGGSNAFADPEIEMSFAYITNGISLDLLGYTRAFALSAAARQCVGAL
ncbi:MAG: beta-lactamase family protein [Chloroflexi bacterium]|nr:beta-lactamase family protein [Chloroflexota bacterium]